uniref:AsIV-cont00008-ORF1 n=1 Tax=Apophua simplicipes ichnovirus TaxID=1329648 RepID=S5DMF6_9VIRU|nr:AsIV-cont00008-ORF1 [Apophua simplicipes ichnovirus]
MCGQFITAQSLVRHSRLLELSVEKMVNSCVLELLETHISTGNSKFHEMALRGSLVALRKIRDNLDHPIVEILRKWNNHGETCLHLAVLMNRGQHAINIIEILVELGADLNARNMSGHNILHYALQNEDRELTNWLLLRQDLIISDQEYYETCMIEDWPIEVSEEEQEEKEEDEEEEDEEGKENTRFSFSAVNDDLVDFETNEYEDMPEWINQLVSLL